MANYSYKFTVFTKNPTATVILAHDSGISFNGQCVNGTVTLNLTANLPDGNGATLTIDSMSFREFCG